MTPPILPAGFAATAFAVFALGLRHGADPDHLAAIDNLTRSAVGVRARLSRFVGTLFAGGHSMIVLSIAALAGMFGQRLASHGAALESAGTWISILVLLLIGALNLRRLLRGDGGAIVGPRTALLPAALRASTSPLAAIPIGLLFGLGFDTSSQVATYALTFTAGSGIAAAVAIGLAFCFGMAVTDTLDSLLVHQLCARPSLEAARAARTWIIAVTILAFGIGAYELMQALGWRSPLPELAVSGMLVAALFLTFAFTVVRSARAPVPEYPCL